MIEYLKGYAVTEEGRIYSRWTSGRFAHLGSEWKELKLHPNEKGYLTVNFRIEKGVYQKQKVHRVVAKTYIPNPYNLPCVRHLDGNNQHNNKDNLAWGTFEENEKDKILHRTSHLRVGGRKLSDKDIKEILNSNLSQQQLAEKYNVSRPTITRLINRTTWQSYLSVVNSVG